THKVENCIVVPKSYISRSDRVLIVDDFLANGQAFEGLIDIVNQASATVVGLTAAVEKGFQGGGDKLREAGFRVESLAVIDAMSPEKIVFRNN
ncbi:MAG: xanthine phosphoribosyltransferase, partial [Clostridia bacterium]|nr:xanthine phosphoribosyltransferase [Clostridia bacterium]